MPVESLRTIVLPCLLMCALFSNAAHAEKFVAKVKFTLVDPVSVRTNTTSESIQVPLKKNQAGTCNIDPKDGSLSGQACHDNDSSSAQIELGGHQHQSVTVNLNGINTSESLSFTPQLFNGTDSDSNFQLTADNHAIYVGGEVNLSHSQDLNQANQLYDVEVLYP